MLPIIVRAATNDKYEILSGHNRVAAVRNSELKTIPAIVRESVSDDNALIIVTESYLLQRSFADLLPSERALASRKFHRLLQKDNI